MTPLDLVRDLRAQGCMLTLLSDGVLRCRAPKGVLTPALVEVMRQHKAALLALVDAEAQPAADPSLRQWVTGATIVTQTLGVVTLPTPIYHDTPHACTTYTRAPCPKKACKAHRTRFRGSGLCVRCWARADKTTRPEDIPDEQGTLL